MFRAVPYNTAVPYNMATKVTIPLNEDSCKNIQMLTMLL